jgi:hypothetical protein
MALWNAFLKARQLGLRASDIQHRVGPEGLRAKILRADAPSVKAAFTPQAAKISA